MGVALAITLPLDVTATPGCVYIEKQNIKTLPLDVILNYVTQDIFEKNGRPGLMIGIISNEERAVISCGEVTKGTDKRPDMNSIWSIGSVSKVITTQILSTLINKGTVRLNTTVDELTGKFNHTGNPVTLLDLATHTSGFPRILPGFEDRDDYQVLNNPYTMNDFLNWYHGFTSPWEPGTHFDYSNVAFGALGQLLAKKMNKSYEDLLSELVTSPLGMKDTTTHLNSEQMTRKVDSYWLNGDLIKHDWDMGFEDPSGGIYSSMNDLLLFTAYQLQRTGNALRTNQIAHASYIYKEELENLVNLAKDPNKEAEVKFDAIALGWMVNFPTDTLPLQLDKDGCVNGVFTVVQLTPTENIGLISLTNSLQGMPFTTMNTSLQHITRYIIRYKQ
ncbi:serine hydrolase [Legionella erythra]|uniref:serine hydrolase n=1 Tax=Legionella erythra TaxID=448 RepID=UPI0013EF98DC|nr:serine hydrolase [Legionella erythra]